MSKFMEKINRTAVAPELLGEVLEMHAAMPAADRGVFEARAIQLFQLLDQKAPGQDRAALAIAIDFRLTALARLQRDEPLRGWTLPGNELGMQVIHADLVKAAANEPLIENLAGEAAFDADSFRRRVLANAEARGNA